MIEVLAGMEMAGVEIDAAHLRRMSGAFAQQMAARPHGATTRQVFTGVGGGGGGGGNSGW